MSGQRIIDGLGEAAQHARAQTGEPTDADLLAVGYAPGDYMSACRDCGSTGWDADKWATRCRPCAVIAWNRRSEPRGDDRGSGLRPLALAEPDSGATADTSGAAEVVAKLREQVRYQYMPAETRVALDTAASLIERLASAPKAEVEGWRPINEAPAAGHVLAGRFVGDDWVQAVVRSPPSYPFTRWAPLPAPPATRDRADEPHLVEASTEREARSHTDPTPDPLVIVKPRRKG